MNGANQVCVRGWLEQVTRWSAEQTATTLALLGDREQPDVAGNCTGMKLAGALNDFEVKSVRCFGRLSAAASDSTTQRRTRLPLTPLVKATDECTTLLANVGRCERGWGAWPAAG